MAGDDDEAAAQAVDPKEMSMEELVKTLLQTVKQNADLIKTLNERAEGPSAEAIRAEKLQKLSVNLTRYVLAKGNRESSRCTIPSLIDCLYFTLQYNTYQSQRPQI